MQQNCNPGHFKRLSRRGFLSVGALAGAGLTLPQLLRTQSAYGDLKDAGRFDPKNRSDKPAWSHPVVCGGRLYLRDMDKLAVYDIKK